MNKQQFIEKLNQLKQATPPEDYFLDLSYKGVHYGRINGQSNFDNIEVYDMISSIFIRADCTLLFADNAELENIHEYYERIKS